MFCKWFQAVLSPSLSGFLCDVFLTARVLGACAVFLSAKEGSSWHRVVAAVFAAESAVLPESSFSRHENTAGRVENRYFPTTCDGCTSTRPNRKTGANSRFSIAQLSLPVKERAVLLSYIACCAAAV